MKTKAQEVVENVAALLTVDSVKAPGSAATLTFPKPITAADLLEVVYPERQPIIENALDAGDKFSIIGCSKGRKTWFGLQLCLCLAAGRSFLQWNIPKPRKVLLVQFEIRDHRIQDRLLKLANGGNFTREDLRRLTVINARGRAREILSSHKTPAGVHVGWNPDFLAWAKAEGFEVILFDPYYKLVIGNENTGEDNKPILEQFDLLAEETGAAPGYIHHTAKGISGDRQAIDRGGGAGVLARDFDSSWNLDNHATEGLHVVEGTFRNHPGGDRQSIRWNSATFMFELDRTPAEIKTSLTKAAGKKTIDMEEARRIITDTLSGGAVVSETVHEDIGDQLDIGDKKQRAVINQMIEEKFIVRHKIGKKDGRTWIFTPQQYREFLQSGSLPS